MTKAKLDQLDAKDTDGTRLGMKASQLLLLGEIRDLLIEIRDKK